MAFLFCRKVVPSGVGVIGVFAANTVLPSYCLSQQVSKSASQQVSKSASQQVSKSASQQVRVKPVLRSR
ncbi:hypothetical protein [Alteromonas mediterranea]|uniref:hypothetical protein n=1 Tax=Alteromonas mediterranea TaxID=314275 RepID=UPI0012DB65C5|nr:hypothetical protein [Alteromonas mediterranea]